ncbi:MAG: hypothetical protein ACNS61_08055 [Candidatus Wenzhouxiangella sp. M2_3B_020]
MKKTLLIAIPVVLAVIALGLPAAIGWLIQDQAGPRLAAQLDEASVEWDRGWFRSAMRIDDPDFRANVEFGHISVSPPGWLTIDGRVILEEPAATVDFEGRIGLGMAPVLHARAPELRIDGPVEWHYDGPVVDVRGGNNNLELTGSADTLLVADGLGNRLPFANPDLQVTVDRSWTNEVSLALTLTASRAGLPESRLVLRMAPLAPGPLEQLVEGLIQLASTERDSATGGLAAVGVASAWQQLGEQGMIVELETLQLDGRLDLTGRWVPGERRFSLAGSGPRETVLAWLSSITGLTGSLRPDTARTAALTTLQDLAADGLVTIDGRTVRVDLDSVPVQ